MLATLGKSNEMRERTSRFRRPIRRIVGLESYDQLNESLIVLGLDHVVPSSTAPGQMRALKRPGRPLFLWLSLVPDRRNSRNSRSSIFLPNARCCSFPSPFVDSIPNNKLTRSQPLEPM